MRNLADSLVPIAGETGKKGKQINQRSLPLTVGAPVELGGGVQYLQTKIETLKKSTNIIYFMDPSPR